MQTYRIFKVNQVGMRAIHDMLGERHKLGFNHFTPDMLNAWACSIESSLMEGNGPEIELKSWETQSGHTETWRIPEEGLDSELVEFEE